MIEATRYEKSVYSQALDKVNRQVADADLAEAYLIEDDPFSALFMEFVAAADETVTLAVAGHGVVQNHQVAK